MVARRKHAVTEGREMMCMVALSKDAALRRVR